MPDRSVDFGDMTIKRSKTDAGAICSQIKALAYERGPNAKLPTVRELCATFDTNSRTLDEVLTKLETERVIYRRQGSGIYVSHKLHQRNVALVIGAAVFRAANTSPFWGSLWGRIIEMAQRRNRQKGDSFSIHIVLGNDGNTKVLDEQLASMIGNGLVDGVIGIGLDQETASWLEAHDLPLAAFGGSGHWQVGIDRSEMIHSGLAYLARQGCRRIRLWMPTNPYVPIASSDRIGGSPHVQEREAYRRGLAELRMPFDDDNIWDLHDHSGMAASIEHQGVWAANRLMEECAGDGTDGLIITDDLMTLGALSKLLQQNSDLLTSLRVASHANKGVLTLYAFQHLITLFEFDPQDIVIQLFHLIDTLLENRLPQASPVLVRPLLVL